MLYLDHAATSPVRPEVLEAMRPYLTDVFGNPSSHHGAGHAAAEALEQARSRVAAALGMRGGDVVFTSGGTEANNLAVKGIVLGGSRRHLVTTAIEHESILASADHLRRFHDAEVTVLPVDGCGRVDPRDLAAAVREDTALVSIGHANNEVGTVQDAAALVAVARERGVPFHLDAVQSAGWLPLAGLGADAVSIAGHKLGAPKGTGALAVRSRIPVEPVLHGGGQERGRRSGTENVAGAVALATALDLAEAERAEAAARVGAATRTFITGVLAQAPGAALTGAPPDSDTADAGAAGAPGRLPSVASFTFAGTSGEAVLLELERRGVLSSSGSACAAGSDEPSPVLLALGIRPEVAQTAVRFTFGRAPLPPDAPERLARLVAEAVTAVGAFSGR
ncbi:cysteine desulfurase family protein [Microbacterium neungamense]|uniref:cysteine desulfurase family protein n=1 Tax=Microbacterium neungamense TaxID=2810535 RepID=UPI00217D6F79|nr:cysteine desulfurase family protein [Microbacterium neungamense]UWF78099.1 cysteine desulfurase [Microbacterium neungamense]